MTMVITSFTPNTGYTTGGTSVTITGTGLDVVTDVLVGNVAGIIVGSVSATTIVFRTPAHAVGTPKITVSDGTAYVQSSGTFAYTAAPALEHQTSTLAKDVRVDVNSGTVSSPTWLLVRGKQSVKPAINSNTVDDSDYESGDWGSTKITQRTWQLDLTVKRAIGDQTNNYDSGQEVLRSAADNASTVQVRWFDTNGGPEAYTGFAQVQWDPQGGDSKSIATVNVSLLGQGLRTTIANPVIADPSLAA